MLIRMDGIYSEGLDQCMQLEFIADRNDFVVTLNNG